MFPSSAGCRCCWACRCTSCRVRRSRSHQPRSTAMCTNRLTRPCLTAIIVSFIALQPLTTAQDKVPNREPDVIFVPTPYEVVNKMLEMADVRPGEIVYDLGCGDGRIPVAAAKKYGVRAWGFDINPVRVKESLETVANGKVKHLVTIKHADVFELDLSKADVITLYLLPALNVKLIPQLDKLKPGCRIVSHDFNMEGVRPKREITFSPNGGCEHRIFLWETPLEKVRPQ
ncbi:MAG: class I SAM-dependent methyltransferase [Planctomycetes bacterium]|nr:class I SAM-dependent methyltransferase [Planctomycetota bacterium]